MATSGLIDNKIQNLKKSTQGNIQNATSKNLQNGPKADNGEVWNKATVDRLEKAFFKPYKIDAERWNRLYPYRLLVVEPASNGTYKIVSGDTTSTHIKSTVNTVGSENGISYVLNQEVIGGGWVANLPITPQHLQIVDQYSITTSATMRGIVEEHGGVKFKNILMSGTTGIYPTRTTIGSALKPLTGISSIFSGTVESFTNLRNTIKSSSMFTGAHQNEPEKPNKPDLFSTGYYQMLYLSQFLERYVEKKRQPQYTKWRLALDIPKQNQTFLVTPVAFIFKQDQQKPMEMFYSLQLKAWKRIQLSQGVTIATNNRLPGLSVNDFQKIVNTITQVRRVLSDSIDVIKAVRNDFRKVFDTYRQLSLVVKDAAGVVLSVADLPNQIIGDAQSAAEDVAATLASVFQAPNNKVSESKSSSLGSIQPTFNVLKQTSGSQKAGVVASAIAQKSKANEGLSSSAVSSGALGTDAAQSNAASPINTVFENPEENFELLNAMSIEDMSLTQQQELAIERELEELRLKRIDDFKSEREETLALALDLSNNFGAGDSTYSNIYGRQAPKDRAIQMSIEENELVAALFDIIQVYDDLTATKLYDDANQLDPLEYVGGLANETQINFETFSSKLAVPVPFGASIEEIAARYMGDPDKWLEIVTLNKLREPYIDEDGFFINLNSNGDGRQFTVFDDQQRLYVGQKILLSSDVVNVFSRKIINLETLSENNYLVTVDKEANLDQLKLIDNAKMQGFLPGTVNSQNQIFIPVNRQAAPDDRIADIPNVSDNQLSKLSKTDLLLDDNGDLAISSGGDFRLSTGLTNLIQALKLKIKTKRGTLLRHLEYGLGLEAGVSLADIENGEILNSLNDMVASDSRFESINSLSIKLDGNTLAIDMVVQLANGSGILPISLDVPAR